MPLSLWVGLNQHTHSIIHACALLSRESEEEYTWALQKFVDCMGWVRSPKQFSPINVRVYKKGLRMFLETVHRFSSWHILNKLTTKWGNIPMRLRRLFIIH